MNTAYSPAVVISHGQSSYEKSPRRTLYAHLTSAIRRALSRADIHPEEVDGLALTSFQLAPDNVTTFADHLGLQLSWGFQGAFGGASGVISVLRAARAIQNGDASTVVCVAGDAFDVSSHMEMLDRGFNSAMRDYLAPLGFGGTNGLFALVQRRHMQEFGTTREQLGKIAVTQRKHAILNPNALLRSPLSIEDYLTARVISDPLRLYDCVLPCAGADAVVVTSRERAASTGRVPINVLAGAEMHNWDPSPMSPVQIRGGWTDFSERMFAAAALKHDQIDMIQLYDDYPIMELIQLEDLGFCNKGEGGPFIDATDFAIDGTLPLNTGGGQLSCGQSGAGGGMIGVGEAVLQLQGEGASRQVANVRTALVSGFGMVGYGRGLSSSAAILSTE